MKNATLLVALSKSAKPSDLETLASVARDRALHLRVLVLGAMPPIPVYVYGAGAYGAYSIPDDWQAKVTASNAALEGARVQIADYLSGQGASAEVRVVSGALVDLAEALARAALTTDLIIFGDDLRRDEDMFDTLLHAALFKAPAGVLLNAMTSASALVPETAMVGWKEGWAAARAVRAALPILRATKEVTVALFDPVMSSSADGENPGSDVAAWLSHQGCAVKVAQYPTGGVAVGAALVKRATEQGADLIVMGAYGHSRLREAVFGGTTRTLVEQTSHPVLLCH